MYRCKKIISLLFIVFICIYFMGCADIWVSSNTLIKSDNSGRISLLVKYDDLISKYTNGSVFNTDWAKENGYKIRKYADNDYNVEELSYDFKNLEDLESKINSTGLITISHIDRLGLMKKTYDFNIKFNKANIDELLRGMINTGDQSQDKYILKQLESLTIKNDIEYPKSKLASNSATVINGIDQWNYKLSQLDENTNINFSYSSSDYSVILIISVVFIISSTCIFTYYKKRTA